MSDYTPPLRDLRFVLNEVVDFSAVSALEGFEAATPDVVDAILEEAGKLSSGVIGPTNATGDRAGSVFENGAARTPDGFREAYRAFVDGGWGGLLFPEEIGGQGLPFTLALAVMEMVTSANMAFSLCPVLTMGAVEALMAHGDDRLKTLYLPKLASSEWAGTMNLTEPQAGSDVGALRMKAEPQADGSYRLKGTKIFITYGEHDLTDNIIHMVLARTPSGPPGTRGISLFLVPKFLVNEDGSLGARNDVHCVSLEEKLGIHASPTAVLAYGETDGAVGYLVGEEHKGMRCMFTMMNHARLLVGLQGLAIGDRAYRHALAYAKDRRQGRRADTPNGESAPIVEHPDVRRMLLLMKSQVEAMRGLALSVGTAYDLARYHPDVAERARQQGLVDLMTPVVKGWFTDTGVEIASLGVQVLGGMGFVEEAGAAQYFRDARIAPIYEGTNGIQALDLVTRKLGLDWGAPFDHYMEDLRDAAASLAATGDGDLQAIGKTLDKAASTVAETGRWLREALARDPDDAAAGATAFLRLFGIVAGGGALARAALAAHRQLQDGSNEPDFYKGKIATARFYGDQVLAQAVALAGPVMCGAAPLYAFSADMLDL